MDHMRAHSAEAEATQALLAAWLIDQLDHHCPLDVRTIDHHAIDGRTLPSFEVNLAGVHCIVHVDLAI